MPHNALRDESCFRITHQPPHLSSHTHKMIQSTPGEDDENVIHFFLLVPYRPFSSCRQTSSEVAGYFRRHTTGRNFLIWGHTRDLDKLKNETSKRRKLERKRGRGNVFWGLMTILPSGDDSRAGTKNACHFCSSRKKKKWEFKHFLIKIFFHNMLHSKSSPPFDIHFRSKKKRGVCF